MSAGLGCREKASAPKTNRLLVVGVDGADPKAFRQLAKAGDLPHLSRLMENGSFAPLKTDFGSAPPVVWTTMVTGLGPDEHGIRDFFVADGSGTYPAVSGARRRPALWDMLERAGRRGAFLGLRATWPAEKTSGLIVSDRAIYDELERTIHPPERLPDLARWREQARSPENPFPKDGVPEQDYLVHLAALEAVADDRLDLVFVHYESVDVVSHKFWHLHYPKPFRGRPPGELRRSEMRNPVREAYRAVDAAIGELLARGPENLDVVVVSDHGFRAQPQAENQVTLGFDLVLADLGFLRWNADNAVDAARSQAWTHDSATYATGKKIAARADLSPRERDDLVRRLRAALSTCRFEGGGAAFELREPSEGDRADGVVLEVVVLPQNASKQLACRDRTVPDAVRFFGGPATGGHDDGTPGILVVSGPLFAQGAVLADASIRDVAPTLLYALGLPLGGDFIGKPAVRLFARDYRSSFPVRQIASWGKRAPEEIQASSADEELVEKLVALGYLP